MLENNLVKKCLKMTSSELEGDVKKSLLDRPDAEKVFQPWWDSVEDYLLNILIALGDLCPLLSILLDILGNQSLYLDY